MAVLLLGPALARAQSYPQWQEGYVPGVATTTTRPIPTTNCTPTASGVPVTCGSWLDWLGAKQDAGAYVVPDSFYQAADGADMAPEITRAQATGSPLRFECHHYAINSAITVTTLANWRGCGWQEEPGSVATAAGTWFDIGPGFVNSTSAPITLSGTGAAGGVIEQIAVDEPGMTAAPIPTVGGSGQTTGWSPSTWSPAAYTEVFRISGAPGVTLRHIFCDGVNACVSSNGGGRGRFEDIRGQAFSYLIAMQEEYDATRVVDVHEWPYWSAADPVMQYQQAHTQAMISDRSDTPFWDRVFALGVLDGVALSANTDGSTTGLQAGIISCDFTEYCVHVYGPASIDGQIGSLRTYGQKWDTVAGDPVTMLPNSTMLQVDGVAVLLISRSNTYSTDKAVVAFTNGTSASNIHLDALYGQISRMSAGAAVVTFPTTGTAQSLLTVNQLMLTPNGPTGFTDTNTSPNGSGVGTFQTATYATQH